MNKPKTFILRALITAVAYTALLLPFQLNLPILEGTDIRPSAFLLSIILFALPFLYSDLHPAWCALSIIVGLATKDYSRRFKISEARDIIISLDQESLLIEKNKMTRYYYYGAGKQ